MKLILASEFYNSFEQTKSYVGDLNGKSVLLIETAAIGEGWSPDPVTEIEPFEKYGASVTLYDLKDKTTQDVQGELSKAHILYVCGGNTFYLLQHMKACGLESILRQRLKEGMIYIGSSAGSIVTGPDIDFIAPMDDPSVAKLSNTKALGLTDFLFLPHLDHETMGDAAKQIISEHKESRQLHVLNDHQALILDNGKVFFV